MSRDAHKMQKRKEKRNKRSKEKCQAHRRAQSVSPFELLAEADDAPFLHCSIDAEAFEVGIGNMLVARGLPDGRALYVVLLIDLKCLGIKNAFYHVMSRSGVASLAAKMHRGAVPATLTPEEARKLVSGAVAYAAQFGLPPHKDFRKVTPIFAGVDASACTREFTFGNDGKPFYMNGPHDTRAFQRHVVATLERTAGPGNFEVVIGIEQVDLDGILDDEYGLDSDDEVIDFVEDEDVEISTGRLRE